MSGPLDGRVAWVTGAAGGLGATFCVGLARAGARVAGTDVVALEETAALVEAVGGEFLGIEADATDPDATDRARDEIVERFGGLHVLVANAGVFPSQPFEALTLDEWRRVTQLNLDGTFLSARAAVAPMRAAGWGRIVVISSSTVWIGAPTLVPYVTTKMGLIGFTRALAVELGELGITVNAITPGLTETQRALESWVGQHFDVVVQTQAVKRREQPDDLVSTLLYLCDEGSAMVTGQTINVDGGAAKH
jgi:3-oxoacyl-[acyl-carrier protein] reductase